MLKASDFSLGDRVTLAGWAFGPHLRVAAVDPKINKVWVMPIKLDPKGSTVTRLDPWRLVKQRGLL